MSRIWDNVSSDELQEIINNSNSLRELAIKLGYSSTHGGYTNSLYKMINERHLDLSKLNENREIQKSINSRKKGMTVQERIDKYFVQNSKVGRNTIRKIILKENIIPYQCDICGNTGIWNGQDMPLELDHINGVYNDHRLNNLRWLCPNCHAITDTYKGRNVDKKYCKKTKRYKTHICKQCGKSIGRTKTNLCRECYVRNIKENIPNRNTIKALIREKSFLSIGQMYGVSDTTVRKWCKVYNLPYTKSEIDNINEIMWDKI